MKQNCGTVELSSHPPLIGSAKIQSLNTTV